MVLPHLQEFRGWQKDQSAVWVTNQQAVWHHPRRHARVIAVLLIGCCPGRVVEQDLNDQILHGDVMPLSRATAVAVARFLGGWR